MNAPSPKSAPAAPPPTPGQKGGPAAGLSQPSVAPLQIDPQVAALSQLLRLEAEARQTPNAAALLHLIANETRGMVRARQAFVLQRRTSKRYRIEAVSSLATVERTAPMIQWVERMMRVLTKSEDPSRLLEFTLPAYADAADTMTASYPFPNFLWVPFWTRTNIGSDGVLLAREIPWLESDKRIAARLAETYGHALLLHRSRPRGMGFKLPVRAASLIVALGLLAAGFIPVPMTALAPLEVVARDPQTVTMPVDGIIQHILVEPNSPIVPGQRLVQLIDTIPRNKFDIADREVQVAAAKLEKASSLSFTDPRGRHELGIARAELELRRAEYDYAKTLLEKTVIVATKAGIAVFPDRKDLEGKPLGTGERVMLIVDAAAVELKIDLAVADSVVLAPGTRAKAFLDSDPMRPLEATVARIDYQARLSESGVAAYHLVASLQDAGHASPQLGVRGTVQLYGPNAPLAIFLLRRPISALRQWVGL